MMKYISEEFDEELVRNGEEINSDWISIVYFHSSYFEGCWKQGEIKEIITSLRFFLLHSGLHTNHDITKIDNVHIYIIMTW